MSLSGRLNRGVSITPGYTTMILTPVSHRSMAIASENAVSAAFDASYAASPGALSWAAVDETFTIVPAPRSNICGSRFMVNRMGEM